MLNLVLLVIKLTFEAFLLRSFVGLCLAQLLLEPLEVRLRIQGAIRVSKRLLGVGLDLAGALTLLLLDQEAHLATLILQNDQLLMLSLHSLFIVSLLELQFAKLFLSHSQFVTQLADLLVIVPVLVQFNQCLLLLFLYFKQRF